MTVVMVEHELSIMDEFCDPVIVMAEGRDPRQGHDGGAARHGGGRGGLPCRLSAETAVALIDDPVGRRRAAHGRADRGLRRKPGDPRHLDLGLARARSSRSSVRTVRARARCSRASSGSSRSCRAPCSSATRTSPDGRPRTSRGSGSATCLRSTTCSRRSPSARTSRWAAISSSAREVCRRGSSTCSRCFRGWARCSAAAPAS